MEPHTREMIRETLVQGLDLNHMFEREGRPDSRVRVLPLATDSATIEVKGSLPCEANLNACR